MKQLILVLVAMAFFVVGCADADRVSQKDVQDSDLLFGDDFSAEDAGAWQVEGDEFGATEIEDGRMFIDIAQHNSMQYTTLAEPEFTDFDLIVEAELIEGERDATYGVLFRIAGPEQFYRFELTGDGRYVVERHDADGNWKRLVSSWQKSPAIDIEPGAVNSLRVVANGPTLTFYVNDELLEELQDNQYPGGKIALDAGTFGGQRTVVAFDNLAMRSP